MISNVLGPVFSFDDTLRTGRLVCLQNFAYVVKIISAIRFFVRRGGLADVQISKNLKKRQ